MRERKHIFTIARLNGEDALQHEIWGFVKKGHFLAPCNKRSSILFLPLWDSVPELAGDLGEGTWQKF